MVCRCLQAGAKLKGYYYWNDADSYEELDGYNLRFGLTWVDHGAALEKQPVLFQPDLPEPHGRLTCIPYEKVL